MCHLFPRVLSYGRFVEFAYGKFVADKEPVGKNLFERLFVDGTRLSSRS